VLNKLESLIYQKLGYEFYKLWCSINPQPSLHSNNSILKTNS